MRLGLLFLMLWAFLADAQVEIIVSKLPKDTPVGTRLFMASSLNNWDPKDENFELKKDKSGRYSLVIETPTKDFEYKFTRGSWETVEGDTEGNALQNRILTPNNQKEIDHQISSWQKLTTRKNTTSPNVKLLAENFHIPQLNTTRKIWIYLPPDYESSSKDYPVIYMHDAQNLFNDETSFSGEWKVDETLDEFFKAGKQTSIIVGIENGGEERLNEYSPWKNPKHGGGKGDQYADFIALTLKPFIDKNYRTETSANSTSIGGSSMGGLISFYTALKYPQIFGNALVLSPSFWFAKEEVFNFVENHQHLKNLKFYFLMGKKESREMVNDVLKMHASLKTKGISDQNIEIKIDEDGTHSESYWAREFPRAYLWLAH